MKKLTVKKGAECMACLQCVQACSEAFYKVNDVTLSCIDIVEKNGAAKPNVCIQCGKCMKVCENEAITQNPKTGVYMINKKKCVSCGKCVEICPMKVMVMPENGPLPSASPAASVSRPAPWRSWRSSKSNCVL